MPRYSVRFQMYGDYVIDADTPDEANQLASNDLIHWSGMGTDADGVQVDGVTIHGDMTEEAGL